jgi:hypothetical protein
MHSNIDIRPTRSAYNEERVGNQAFVATREHSYDLISVMIDLLHGEPVRRKQCSGNGSWCCADRRGMCHPSINVRANRPALTSLGRR